MNDRLEIASRLMAGWLASFAPDAKHPVNTGIACATSENALALADMLIAREAATRPADPPKPNLVFLTPEDAEIIRNAKPDSLFQLRVAGSVVQKVEVAK